MASPNLWPAALGDPTNKPLPPLAVLRDQADYLDKVTQTKVRGHVTTSRMADGTLSHFFSFLVPALDNYSYQVLVVNHDPVKLYPAAIEAYVTETRYTAINSDDFINHLRMILNEPRTQQALQALMAQAEAVEPLVPQL